MCFVLTASLVFILDRVSKIYISVLLSSQKAYPVVKNVFHLTLVKNKGAAFGLLPGWLPLFLTVSLVTIIIILSLHFQKKIKASIGAFSLGLILGGTLGNLYDRLFYGAVIDFLDFRFWPVFNLADSAITIGVIILAWICLREKPLSNGASE